MDAAHYCDDKFILKITEFKSYMEMSCDKKSFTKITKVVLMYNFTELLPYSRPALYKPFTFIYKY